MKQESWVFAVMLVGAGCVAPRSVVQSGRVTPKGEFRPGAEMNFNIGTASGEALVDGLSTTVDEVSEKEDGTYDESINAAAKAAVAYSLDPVFASGYTFSLRYGVLERLDAGLKYSSGAYAIDARFQFLGDPGERASSDTYGEGTKGMAGSIGLQYSKQSFELPSFAGLDKVGSIFGFHMDRHDLLVPLAFSNSFGADEKYGAFSYGVVGGYTFLKYGLDPHDLVKEVDGVEEAVAGVSREQGFATFGGFAHVKVGYRYAFVGAGVAVYYQDYGKFELLDEVEFEMQGWTIVPTINAEIRY